jgi:hypothetical protein
MKKLENENSKKELGLRIPCPSEESLSVVWGKFGGFAKGGALRAPMQFAVYLWGPSSRNINTRPRRACARHTLPPSPKTTKHRAGECQEDGVGPALRDRRSGVRSKPVPCPVDFNDKL